jgi:hypothetical protein
MKFILMHGMEHTKVRKYLQMVNGEKFKEDRNCLFKSSNPGFVWEKLRESINNLSQNS